MKIGDENLFEVGCSELETCSEIVESDTFNLFSFSFSPSGIEAPRIGDHNTFEPRCKVSQSVQIGSFSTIGAACTLTSGIAHSQSTSLEKDEMEDILSFSDSNLTVEGSGKSSIPDGSSSPFQTETGEKVSSSSSDVDSTIKSDDSPKVFEPEQLPDNLVIYGSDSRSRIWSGEGVKQAAALHAKHLSYLQDSE